MRGWGTSKFCSNVVRTWNSQKLLFIFSEHSISAEQIREQRLNNYRKWIYFVPQTGEFQLNTSNALIWTNIWLQSYNQSFRRYTWSISSLRHQYCWPAAVCHAPDSGCWKHDDCSRASHNLHRAPQGTNIWHQQEGPSRLAPGWKPSFWGPLANLLRRRPTSAQEHFDKY